MSPGLGRPRRRQAHRSACDTTSLESLYSGDNDLMLMYVRGTQRRDRGSGSRHVAI